MKMIRVEFCVPENCFLEGGVQGEFECREAVCSSFYCKSGTLAIEVCSFRERNDVYTEEHAFWF
jgi:hypothetical protein